MTIHSRNLKSIAFAAPYLGLVGTCAGILSAFKGYSGSPAGFVAMIASGLVVSLVTTVAGLLVAIAAIGAYNYTLTRLDSLRSRFPSNATELKDNSFLVAQSLPLAKRLSEVPAFALIAAPCLAISIAALMMFASFQIPVGFVIEVASPACNPPDRVIVLRLTHTGELFINFEPVNQSTLANRLSQIYRTRAERKLYLLVDDDVPFQSAAEVLNIVRNTSFTTFASEPTFFSQPEKVYLNISVSLLTPALAKADCLTPISMP